MLTAPGPLAPEPAPSGGLFYAYRPESAKPFAIPRVSDGAGTNPREVFKMNCDTSSACASMFAQVGKRLINPWWSISADGALYNRAPGGLVFTQVIQLPFYTAHSDWNVEHELTADGEVIHFKAVNRPELRCKSYEYRASYNAAVPAEQSPAEEPIRQEERSAQGSFISALGLDSKLRSFTKDKLIWQLGFIPTDEYLQDEYGDRWQQVRRALKELVEG